MRHGFVFLACVSRPTWCAAATARLCSSRGCSTRSRAGWTAVSSPAIAADVGARLDLRIHLRAGRVRGRAQARPTGPDRPPRDGTPPSLERLNALLALRLRAGVVGERPVNALAALLACDVLAWEPRTGSAPGRARGDAQAGARGDRRAAPRRGADRQEQHRVIPAVSRGGRMRGLLRYLVGPGHDGEHRDPHLVAGERVEARWQRRQARRVGHAR